MEDTEANFLHLESEYWIGILNTNELKDERKKASDSILKNKPSTRKKSDCAEDYDRGGSLRVTLKKIRLGQYRIRPRMILQSTN